MPPGSNKDCQEEATSTLTQGAIVFPHKITDADKEKWLAQGGIETVMRTELPGLLNWVISMTDDKVHQAIGGINTGLTRGQREHYTQTNKFAAWLDDNVVAEESSVIHVGLNPDKNADDAEIEKLRETKLYPNYTGWCAANGVQPIAVQRFSANLLDVCEFLKLPVKKLAKNKDGARFQGLRIRTHNDNRQTLVTLQSLLNNDTECRRNDGAGMPGSCGNDDGDEDDEGNLFHKNADDFAYKTEILIEGKI